MTECLRLFCFSSSRTNHSGCSFLSSLTVTLLGAEKSSATFSARFPGPELFLILFSPLPSSERMLEDLRFYFDFNARTVLYVHCYYRSILFWPSLNVHEKDVIPIITQGSQNCYFCYNKKCRMKPHIYLFNLGNVVIGWPDFMYYMVTAQCCH